ncbi:MAG TPA: AAA family ATPase [Ktedonobacteraceae bacterium]|nr:AAA family ATPase [Ktedonobacteraceae bacterium]
MQHPVNRPILCPKIIGRSPESAALGLLVEQAKAGQGHIALIAGEAGIGKSRLVSELKALAVAQEFLVMQGACFPTDIAYPYAPLLDLLRSLVASNQKGSLTAAVETLAHNIFPLLPELVPDQTPPLPRLEPEQEKHRLFAVLATFFLHLSTQSPVLLIIEDVHWSDDTSLDFFHHLIRRAAFHPLLLLVTYRSEEMQPALSNWLAQLDRERLAHKIQLVPLARNEVDTMLSAIFEERDTSFDMRRFLHGELLDVLYTLTEGNPFFVEETLSSLIAAGDIFYAQGYWNRTSAHEVSIPQSIQDAVQRRTARVGEETRYVLTLAAVAGRHFDFALLQQLTRYDEGQLLQIMKELVSAQLVIEESADQFAFRHALTRQAIYSQLLTRERRVLHQSIAETMEQRPPVTPDLHLEDLAYHFYQARDWQKAVDYAQRAGEKALGLYSHRAAIDYFTWALEAADHLSLPPSTPSPGLRPALYGARGHAYETLGEFDQAQHDYTQALDAARKMNSRAAEWQSAIDLGFLWAGRDYAQAETWFRQALTLAQALDDPVLHARSLNRIGNWHLNVGQPQEALGYHREALTIFQQLHDSGGIAETLDLLGMTSYLGGDLIGGTSYYQQAVALFDELGNREGLTSSLATLTMRAPTYHTDTLIAVASLAEVLPDAERAVKVAREIGLRSAESYALFQLGLCLGSQGEYTRALTACQQSLHIAEEIEHRQWQTAAHAMLGGVYTGMLAHQEASEHFEQALVLAQETHSLFWTRMATGYLASVSVLLRDYTRAETLLHAALGSDTAIQTLGQRMLYCASAELALARGDPARALEIVDQLDASQIAGGQSSLRVLKLRGEALAALQRPAEAEAALTAAQALAVALGVRPKQWQMCIALGSLYQAQERNAEAEQAFVTARTLIEELAATITDESLRDNFRQQAMTLLPSSRPLSHRQIAKQAYGGLTAREREIAALIAQGKFNREIADILVLSERTIETHVSNIMFKLGFTSRRQIASWAIERGLTANT